LTSGKDFWLLLLVVMMMSGTKAAVIAAIAPFTRQAYRLEYRSRRGTRKTIEKPIMNLLEHKSLPNNKKIGQRIFFSENQ